MKKFGYILGVLGLLAGCSDDPAECNMTSAVNFYITHNKSFLERGKQPDIPFEYIKKHIVKKIENTGLKHKVYGTPLCKVTYLNIDYDVEQKVWADMSFPGHMVYAQKESTACYVFKNTISGPTYEFVSGDGCCKPGLARIEDSKNGCWF